MIVEDAVYEAYLSETRDTYFPLNNAGAAPSDKALPDVHPEIRKKVTDRD